MPSSPTRPRASRRAAALAGALLALVVAGVGAAPASAVDYGGGGGPENTKARYPASFALVGIRYATTTGRASTTATVLTRCGVRTVGVEDQVTTQGLIVFTKRSRGVDVEVRLQLTGPTGVGTVKATGRVRGRSCALEHRVKVAAPSALKSALGPEVPRFGVLRGRDSGGFPLPYATLVRGDRRQTAVWASPNRCRPRAAQGLSFFRSKPFTPVARPDVVDRFRFTGAVRGSGVSRVRGELDADGVLVGRVSERSTARRGSRSVSCTTGSRRFSAAPVG